MRPLKALINLSRDFLKWLEITRFQLKCMVKDILSGYLHISSKESPLPDQCMITDVLSGTDIESDWCFKLHYFNQRRWENVKPQPLSTLFSILKESNDSFTNISYNLSSSFTGQPLRYRCVLKIFVNANCRLDGLQKELTVPDLFCAQLLKTESDSLGGWIAMMIISFFHKHLQW